VQAQLVARPAEEVSDHAINCPLAKQLGRKKRPVKVAPPALFARQDTFLGQPLEQRLDGCVGERAQGKKFRANAVHRSLASRPEHFHAFLLERW